jgi:hypothetical protein
VIRTSSEVDNQSTYNEASNKGDYAKRSTPPRDKGEKHTLDDGEDELG